MVIALKLNSQIEISNNPNKKDLQICKCVKIRTLSENEASLALDCWTGEDTIWMQISQCTAIVKHEVIF